MSRILIIDDNETIASGLALLVGQAGHEGIAAGSGREGMERLAAGPFDLVITDYRMDGMNGIEVLEAVKVQSPDTDVMLNTAYGTIEIAVEAMRKGAVDFLTKDLPHQAIRFKVQQVLDYRRARRESMRLGEENQYLRQEIDDRYGTIIGCSDAMNQVLARVEKVAQTDSSVLIYGESGTGKELVARAVHNRGGRRTGPFVRVNCGALPRELIESELFGHEKGAFTGASRLKKGKFELADGGTIFLDEIGDIPLDLQVKLLRVLQEKEIDRVGGEKTISVDARVVAATNRPLKEMVAEGSFRQDLYYRLEVIPLTLPPLRQRRDDIPLLVGHFLKKKSQEINTPLKRLTPEGMRHLVDYAWPGNVRELENVIERTIVLSDGDEIGVQDLPIDIPDTSADLGQVSGAPAGEDDGDIPLTRILEGTERDCIERAMEQAQGIKSKAAEILGIKSGALYYKLDKYGLDRSGITSE
jgi:two-component system, NtrC family, response regulator HydG